MIEMTTDGGPYRTSSRGPRRPRWLAHPVLLRLASLGIDQTVVTVHKKREEGTPGGAPSSHLDIR
jgi:hypothetical protein